VLELLIFWKHRGPTISVSLVKTGFDAGEQILGKHQVLVIIGEGVTDRSINAQSFERLIIKLDIVELLEQIQQDHSSEVLFIVLQPNVISSMLES
jgi:hypothetical protein